MSTRKLLDKLKGILSAEHDAQQKKYKSLKKILKALRDEKAHLKKEIERVTDEEDREHLEARPGRGLPGQYRYTGFRGGRGGGTI